MMAVSWRLVGLLWLLVRGSTAFVVTSPCRTAPSWSPSGSRRSSLHQALPLTDLTESISPSSLSWTSSSSEQLQEAATTFVGATAPSSSSLMLSDAWDILRMVGIGLTVIVFALAALSYFAASVLIPQAAEQLEKEVQDLAPDLWDEYQAKLAEGETMAMRPDLMQELGTKIQPLLEKKIAEQVERNEQATENVAAGTTVAATPQPTETTAAMDAQIVVEQDDEDDDEYWDEDDEEYEYYDDDEEYEDDDEEYENEDEDESEDEPKATS